MCRLTVLLVCLVALGGSNVVAGTSGTIGDGGIGASADSSEMVAVTESTVPVVVCEWRGDQLHYRTGQTTSGEYVYTYIDQMYWRYRPSTGEVWVQAHRVCLEGDEVVSSSLEWRRVVEPDPGVLAGSVFDEVVRQVPVPEPVLSPVGPGFVNLGMWLAVEESPPVSVTARAGSVWATTSAEVVSTSFDMGDGTVVVCDGVGDPIPSVMLDSVEASPVCGHTYTSVNGREPFVVTVTSTWRVWWVGSGGVGGDLGLLDRSSSLEYRVLEIQTVGG